MLESGPFNQRVKARWAELRLSVFSLNNINGLLDGYVASIGTNAIDENFKRWPILDQYVWPNPPPFYDTYGEHLDELKRWIAARVAWLDSGIVDLEPTWGESRPRPPPSTPSALAPRPDPSMPPQPLPPLCTIPDTSVDLAKGQLAQASSVQA